MKSIGFLRAGQCKMRSVRRGSVVFLLALSMVVLCGFCALGVDYGRAVLVRNQLQRACDAAALAGARYLPDNPEDAKDSAVAYAWMNNKTEVKKAEIELFNDNMHIRVRSTQNIRYLFAPVMKILSGSISARATAAVQQQSNFMSPLSGPIGITPSTYEAHKDGSSFVLTGINQKSDDLVANKFVLFDLRASSGKSPAQMERQLEWGSTFDEPTSVGDTETTVNANSQEGFFESAMLTRIAAAAGSPWFDNGDKYPNIPSGSPRLMFFIVTPEQPATSGGNDALVLGFVPVYIESMRVSGDDMQLTIRMLPVDTAGSGSYDDASANPTVAGLRLYRLVD
jgi:Flp pilus assembly protein TadG